MKVDMANGITTAWDLAGQWPEDVTGFRVKGGRVIWEMATATETDRVRLDRIEPTGETVADGLRVFSRYVDPDTQVEVVK